jgi:hypothetical protein
MIHLKHILMNKKIIWKLILLCIHMDQNHHQHLDYHQRHPLSITDIWKICYYTNWNYVPKYKNVWKNKENFYVSIGTKISGIKIEFEVNNDTTVVVSWCKLIWKKKKEKRKTNNTFSFKYLIVFYLVTIDNCKENMVSVTVFFEQINFKCRSCCRKKQNMVAKMTSTNRY